jgi:hypothetical protein
MGGTATFLSTSSNIGTLEQMGGSLTGSLNVQNVKLEAGRYVSGTMTVTGQADLSNSIVGGTMKLLGRSAIHKTLTVSGAIQISNKTYVQNCAVTLLHGSAGVSVNSNNGFLLLDSVNITGMGNNDITIADTASVGMFNGTTNFNNVAVSGTSQASFVVGSKLVTLGGSISSAYMSLLAGGKVSGSQTALTLSKVYGAAASIHTTLGGYSLDCTAPCSNITTSGSTEPFSLTTQ